MIANKENQDASATIYSGSGGADASTLHDEEACEDPRGSPVEDTMRSNVLGCSEGCKTTGKNSIITLLTTQLGEGTNYTRSVLNG